MPGNVSFASPATVMPYSLSRAFTETREHVQRIAGPYADGRMDVSVDSILPRKSWALTSCMPFADFADLFAFYVDCNGSQEAFYFYPERAYHDPTGASPTGRYTVRFDGAFSREYRLGRVYANYRLIEVQ